MTSHRWLITGCSSGLGHALASHLVREGAQVLATARDVSGLDFPHVQRLDVRDPDQCEAAVKAAVERFGGIDVLVNNAGYGQFGVVEEVSDAQLAAQMDTNLYGPWRLTRLVLPLWREQGSGHAIFVSSLSGSMPFPGVAAYTASKFALEGMAESLAQETAHLGVKVTILQLGGFATAYGKKAADPAVRIPAYAPVVDDMLAMFRGLHQNPDVSRPSLFGETVARLAAMPEPPLRLAFGEGAKEYLDAALTARRQLLDLEF